MPSQWAVKHKCPCVLGQGRWVYVEVQVCFCSFPWRPRERLVIPQGPCSLTVCGAMGLKTRLLITWPTPPLTCPVCTFTPLPAYPHTPVYTQTYARTWLQPGTPHHSPPTPPATASPSPATLLLLPPLPLLRLRDLCHSHGGSCAPSRGWEGRRHQWLPTPAHAPSGAALAGGHLAVVWRGALELGGAGASSALPTIPLP